MPSEPKTSQTDAGCVVPSHSILPKEHDSDSVSESITTISKFGGVIRIVSGEQLKE